MLGFQSICFFFIYEVEIKFVNINKPINFCFFFFMLIVLYCFVLLFLQLFQLRHFNICIMLCGDEQFFNLINRKFKNPEYGLNGHWIIIVLVKNLGKYMIVHYFAFLKQFYAFFAINIALKSEPHL